MAELDRHDPGSDRTVYPNRDRRSKSIGNLRHPTVDDSEESDNYYNARPRSASQSRTHRSVRPDIPPPQPPLYDTHFRAHRSHHNDINHDNDDPDLTFDDPRHGDRSRECTPVRDMNRIQRPSLLYGEQRSHSIGNLQPRYTGGSGRQLQGTKSASQSRSSLRSNKRRAPQPPGHPGVTALARHSPSEANGYNGVAGTSGSGRTTPVQKYKNNRRYPNEASSPYNFSHNSKKKEASKRPKYFNPYAVRLPTTTSKSRTKAPQMEEESNNSSTAAILPDFPKTDRRRYSDTHSLDESEHGFEEAQQADLMGDFDGVDDMYDDCYD